MLRSMGVRCRVALFSVIALGLCACSEPVDPGKPGETTPSPPLAEAPPLPQPGTVPVDEFGYFQYIVDLRKGSADGYAEVAPEDGRFPSYDKAQVRNLIYEFEAKYGIHVDSLTSWVGPSFTAFLSPEQIEAVREDTRVELITPNFYDIPPSADTKSVWLDQSLPGGEIIPWGKQAINPFAVPSSGNTRVYVIDYGTGHHPDLNVVQQVHPQDELNPKWDSVPGCYPHGLHVAGIIGAKADGTGIQGISPGVPIVSVLLQPKTSYKPSCIPDGNTVSSFAEALNWVASDIVARQQVGIINLSYRHPEFKSNATIGKKMWDIAQRPENYPNAFIVQSAGNDNDDACKRAYDLPSDADGIMVVGAINDHGQQVVPLNGIWGFYEHVSYTTDSWDNKEWGSNYGSCVDVWAPGRSIYSTWENGSYAPLSGTSMAAPHVAGLAAYIAETEGATDSADLESKVRAKLKNLGSVDLSGAAIQMPTLAPLPNPANTPYAEIVINGDPNSINNFSKHPHPIYVEDGYDFSLQFDSRGTNPYDCDLYRTPLDPQGAPELLFSAITKTPAQSYNWGGGTWEISSPQCPSAHAKIAYANRPKVHWFVDGVETLSANAYFAKVVTEDVVLSYASEGTDACSLTVNQYASLGTLWLGPLQTWEDKGLPTSATNVLKSKNKGYYRYQLTCSDMYGTVVPRTVDVSFDDPQPPPPGALGAVYTSQSVPSQIGVGQLFPVSLTFSNNGTSTWTSSDNFYLAAINNNKTWGYNKIKLEPGETVAPGQQKTFSLNVLAPYVPGSYTFQWQMVKDGAFWFGDVSPATSINVTVPASLIQPVTGVWHNPNRPGWKLSVSHNNSGQVLLLWHTFSQSGQPIWYYGVAGKKNMGVYSSDQTPEGMIITKWANGSVGFTSIGQMYYAPLGNNKGTFSWSLNGEIGAETVEYEGINGPAPQPFTGHWYPPSQNGWGFSADVQGGNAKTLVTFYDAAGQPTWASGSGSASGNGCSIPALDIWKGTNLCPGCTGPVSTSAQPAGWMQINNIDLVANSAILLTSLVPFPNAPSLQVGGVAIQRLTY